MKFSNAAAVIIATLAASVSAAAIMDTKLEARIALPEPTDGGVHATPTLGSLTTPTTNEVLPRQSQQVDSTHPDEESAQNALDDSRAEGRRKLSATAANCRTSACHTCMNASTTASLAEVAACGLVAAGAEVGSAGGATVFVVSGFAACETAIVAGMAKSVVECEAL